VIDKSEQSLRLFAGKIEVQKFNVALGSAAGPKCVQGDRRTPEERYTVIGKLSKSAYHKALRLSYPERRDVDCAKTQNRQPGGDIMIHGLPNGRGFFGAVHHLKNWTQGCIAVRNDEIDYLFNVIRVGTVVEIIPGATELGDRRVEGSDSFAAHHFQESVGDVDTWTLRRALRGAEQRLPSLQGSSTSTFILIPFLSL
jgi:murein L,D-transpeptidase YafK